MLWEQDVRSSNPLTPTIFGSLAQLVEQLAFNQLVVGSNPTRPTIFSWFVSGWILGSDATSVIQIENASSEVFFSIIGV
ncbi:hypothetical protein ALQ07_102885 [Pseudomonas syringae pv. actinidiae]|uniref:Uncharacterized protein n=3 Tax=Pseudomonas syringae group TaxID=136849 RepID=A0A0P9IHE0_9PSED|nr:hypothetical protein ALO87_102551 [Pseudomonas syringae pv. apii]RMQ25468.1 hypothetical protein ALQ07_102885 [Pseudomonas syringae pv. actinidiae]RMR13030.1 hypothetical protein ALP92_103672 [Pseudomonas syringae pv. primulae]RMN45375.1 hypothetical protein ALQ59_102878 [Pseudomonas syringae pv. apii]RMN54519.1 hypothetical protein ALQ58_102502 [Pseudomonas syringae pv. apii]